MFCPSCGTNVPENATSCPQCAAKIGAPNETSIFTPKNGAAAAAPEKVTNWLVPSILVTAFCCIPMGVPAIVFAVLANTMAEDGQIDKAQKAAANAKRFFWLALVLWAIGFVIWITFYILSIVIGSAAAVQN